RPTRPTRPNHTYPTNLTNQTDPTVYTVVMHQKQSRWGVGLAAALGATVSLAAQGTPAGQKPPAAPPPSGQTAPGQPTFRVAIDFVTMDAIVSNAQDQFVADLNKDDFEVYEDAVKQESPSLTLVHGGRVHNLQAAPPPAAQ